MAVLGSLKHSANLACQQIVEAEARDVAGWLQVVNITHDDNSRG